jgi:hypothetical protein
MILAHTMFQDVWPPEGRSRTMHRGVALPRLPTKPIKKAEYTYQPGLKYTLHPNLYPFTTPSSTAVHPSDPTNVTIEILYPVDVGHRHRSQVVLARVTDAKNMMPGETVVMRCFDPLFYSVHDLPTLRFPGYPATLQTAEAIDSNLNSQDSTTSISDTESKDSTGISIPRAPPSPGPSTSQNTSDSLVSLLGDTSLESGSISVRDHEGKDGSSPNRPNKVPIVNPSCFPSRSHVHSFPSLKSFPHTAIRMKFRYIPTYIRS